jgi:glucosamine--fructose-6-phosphate aminotransferase (isomerizing)
MCGVIGYVGRRRAQDRLLKGLERLEYRGYDSAGICLLDDEGLSAVRAVGKLENLRRRLDGRPGRPATAGIGHTRWATHGRVSEENAHPLTAGDGDSVAIVLNGIIENFAEIRQELISAGARFTSETDAEVVVHLIERAYRGDLAAAVRAIYRRLEGHFAFVAVHRDEPDTLVGTRRQCPLLVGVGDGETFVASSITAFGGETRRVVVLEDDEVVAVTADRVRVTSAAGLPIERPEVEVEWDDEVAEKGGHETFMLKEIHEQPQAVGATIARDLERAPLDATHLGPIDLRGVRRLVVVSCGTAYHAGLVGRYAVEEWAGVPCDLDIASEWRHRNPLLEEGTLVVGISQSGETADTLASLRLARLRGARTLGITNSPGSQITREVDHVLFTHAGLEMGVAATKTFTAQVVLMNLLALRLAKVRASLLDEQIAPLLAELRALPHKIAACLEEAGAADEIAERFHERPFFLYLGRHAGLPVCLEGALKLKEISYIPTEAYAAGEMKHGPIALLDDRTPVVCVATESHVSDKLLSNLQEVRARGAEVIAVATAGADAVGDVAQHVLEVPRTHPLLQPVVAVVPLQVLAYRIACLRGLDVDQPRNLAKTVTVE